MPTETILVLCAIGAMFAFFASVVTYADMTWDANRVRNDRR